MAVPDPWGDMPDWMPVFEDFRPGGSRGGLTVGELRREARAKAAEAAKPTPTPSRETPMATDKKTKRKNHEPVMLDIGILCALTEDAPKPEELVSPASDDDGAEDYDLVPLDWIQIRITRRVVNPEYLQFVQAKEESIRAGFEQAMAQAAAQNVVPTDEEKTATEQVMRKTVEATFYAVLQATPQYITVTEDVWVSPPERNKQVEEEISRLGKGLNIDLSGKDE